MSKYLMLVTILSCIFSSLSYAACPTRNNRPELYEDSQNMKDVFKQTQALSYGAASSSCSIEELTEISVYLSQRASSFAAAEKVEEQQGINQFTTIGSAHDLKGLYLAASSVVELKLKMLTH